MRVDFRFSAPTEEGLAPVLGGSDRLEGYRDVYSKTMAQATREYLKDPDELAVFLDGHGIDVAVLFAANSRAVQVSYPNEKLAEYVQQRPDRLVGLAGVDPRVGQRAVAAEIEHAINDLGFVGVNIGPWTHRMATDDRAYYPVYAKCQELGVPVVIHCSISFDRGAKLDWEHPRRIDEVASDFPDLTIVASHGGWPWVNELVAVAWRHPTVHIELSAIRPKYLATEGSGWAPLLQYGNTLLKDRILWGSAWPALDIEQSIEDVNGLPLKDDVREKWLGENAARLLGLDGGTRDRALESREARS